MRRNVTNADGSRTSQLYIGQSKTYAEAGWDAPGNWKDELTVKPGEIIGHDPEKDREHYTVSPKGVVVVPRGKSRFFY